MMDDADLDIQTLTDTMEGMEGEIEDKVDGYEKIILEKQSEIDAIDAEIKRLKARKDAIEKNIDRMKEVVKTAMKAMDKLKIKTLLFSFSVVKNPVRLEIDEQTKIPAYYYEIPEPKPQLNKALIKADLKEGKTVEGAHLEHGESLRIK